MTVCRVQRNNAEERFQAILRGGKDPGLTAPPAVDETTGEEVPTDIEQLATDQIRGHIERQFRGHDLARLVDAVLRAEGYITLVSSPGADGGVDILAARGTLGFESPRLCVQVKSSASPADVGVLRELQGTMQTFQAQQGLLVCWGGFKASVVREARMSFFSVRLWNSTDLIDAVLRNYDRLPAEFKGELPMKKIWALVLEA
jgi:restriction system protein